MAKTMLVVFLSALLICSLLTQDVDATKFIDYSTMGGDTIPCSKKNPGSCTPIPANSYHRGCEKEEMCHDEKTGRR